MTRATYNTDNTLTEISDYGPPPDKPESKFYGNEREMFQRDLLAWRRVMQDFEFHKARYEKTLRTIPCSPECRGLWKPGQVLEEGRDYEIKGAGDWKWASQLKGNVFAAPVVAVKSEAPFAWTDELVKEYAEQYRFSSSRISIEQFKQSLTKR